MPLDIMMTVLSITIYVLAAAVFLFRFWQRLCFVCDRLSFNSCAVSSGYALCRKEN